jgi:hypothetical protein
MDDGPTMQRLTVAGSLKGTMTGRALVGEATWRPLDDIGETATVASGLTSIVWYLTMSITVALAIHGLVRKNVRGTNRPVVRGHLHQGEIESVTEMGIETEIGTGGIETETGNENENGTGNGIVITVVVGTMSDAVVDSCTLCLPYPCISMCITTFTNNSTQPQYSLNLPYPMLSHPYRRACTSHSLYILNYGPRIFLRANKTASAKLFEDALNPGEPEEERRLAARREHLEQVMGVGRQQGGNWAGKENLQDRVLRMLFDKYKPLQAGSKLPVRSSRRTLPRLPEDFLRRLKTKMKGAVA